MTFFSKCTHSQITSALITSELAVVAHKDRVRYYRVDKHTLARLCRLLRLSGAVFTEYPNGDLLARL